jgi:hypothetical protein
MIQFNGVSPFSINTTDQPTLINAAGQADGASFQSQLSAALSSTLKQFGINPNNVNLSIAPIVTGSAQTPFTAAAETTPATATPAQTSDGTLASQDPILSFDAAYWASQPPAVQALQNIDDPAQRSIAAAQLAASGYQIDTPIMVWGWDPSKVTSLRQEMGYKWVPSAFQTPVAAAPGLSNGSQVYDPTNPPSGSIAV